MKKILSLLAAGCLFSIFLASPALATADFDTAYQIDYQLTPQETVAVTQKISLTNKRADTYPTEYLLQIGGMEIRQVKAADALGEIQPELTQKEDLLEIKLRFNEKVVGEGKTLTFTLSYQAINVLAKNGEVWEINLPHPPSMPNLTAGVVTLSVPKSFGPLAYITPAGFTASEDDLHRYYRFHQKDTGQANISAAFGQFQIFDFQLDYHLHNPESTPGLYSIAFPPDTSFQRVFYHQIKPAPQNITLDSDGNWLGLYRLEPEETQNIIAKGQIQIFSQPQDYYPKPSPESLNLSLQPQEFWESDKSQIAEIAQDLKSAEAIYRFVVNRLDYDYSKIEKSPPRKGALKALNEPQTSICMEFTDLFIALCRAAGIPAREINGFAYTTNPKLKPLSLVVDVLHSWPEYWHEEKKLWLPVDPTWEKSTGGRDYFYKFDLNHVVFAIHGADSQSPLPAGAYKTGAEVARDVQINFGQYQPPDPKDLEVEFIFPQISLLNSQSVKAVISNPNPTAKYDLKLKVAAAHPGLDPQLGSNSTLPVIPPYGQIEIPIQIKTPKIYQFGKAEIKLTVDQKEFTSSFQIESLTWPKILLSFIGLLLGLGWIRFLSKLTPALTRKYYAWKKPPAGLTN